MNWNGLLNLKLKVFKHLPSFIIDKIQLDDDEKNIMWFLVEWMNIGKNTVVQRTCFHAHGNGKGFCMLRAKKPIDYFNVGVNVHSGFDLFEPDMMVSHGLMVLSKDESMKQAITEIKKLYLEQVGFLEEEKDSMTSMGFDNLKYGIYECNGLKVTAWNGYNKIGSKIILHYSPFQAVLNYVASEKPNLCQLLPPKMRDGFLKGKIEETRIVDVKNFDDFARQNHVGKTVYRSLHDEIKLISIWEILKDLFKKAS